MNKKKEGKPKVLIMTVTVVSVVLLLGFITIVISSFFLPKNNNLDAFTGNERAVAERALEVVMQTPSPARREYSVSSVENTVLDGKCNDVIGVPPNGSGLPAQRYEIALSDMTINGLFDPPILIHICVY